MEMRKPIDKKNCIEAGYIKKPHGVKGDTLMVLEQGFELDIEELGFVFFEIEGLLVPFQVEQYEWRGDSSINFKFRLIENKEQAQQFVGCKVFIDREHIELEGVEMNQQMLKGYTLTDKNLGFIGAIEEVNDYGGNLVLTVSYQGQEALIPYNDDLLVSIDTHELTIELDCPEGLFDMEEEEEEH